ncbi:uncharacterized protein LOC125274620 [Megalobrama amblycephala]|uniref:uncharacterized protein LOC125274620 n=1 Tax=Megalobrama amblycephala TaxID=75352 RepID=UPI0020146D2D|nr:uncharacterized protein LOC125274620 [Megalobrama amblycephala]
MFKHLNLLLLLLLYIFNYSETTTRSVKGKKGGNVTLSCDFKAKDIYYIHLSRRKSILSCQNEECESESESESQNGRVFKEGSCDVIIKDLRLSDAGKYILRIYYTSYQTELKRQIRTYRLHFQDFISVKKGEELKMDVLLMNAYKVVHWSRRSTGRKEDWNRGHGVRSDRMTIRDGNLTISNFTSTDAGTYEVLDSEGEILIMVTVTESKDKMNYINYDTQQHTPPIPSEAYWIVPVELSVFLLILVALKRKRMHRCPGAQMHIC